MKFLNACCCRCCGCRCCSLRSGSVAVGAIHVALWIIGFIIVIAVMCSGDPYREPSANMRGLIPVVLFHLIVHTCLIHGAKKGERVLLLPFIVVFGLEVLTAGVGSFIGIYLWSSAGYHSIGGYVFLVIPPIIGGMTLAVYLWMIVWSYFIELGETQTGLPYCNRPHCNPPTSSLQSYNRPGNIYEETYPRKDVIIL